MKYNFDTSRMGMLIFLGVVLTALWLVAAYGFYKESERAKYDVQISPGSVSYGTHSMALMPMTVSPMKHTLPMLSGGAIRSYAHSGHATMPATAAKQDVIHTTSSAKVKNIGSGIGSGGIMTTYNSSSRRGERGITYAGGNTVTMPSIAMVSVSSMARAAAPAAPFRMRQAAPTGPGYEGQVENGGDGWYIYDPKAGGWRLVTIGDARLDGGKTYYWNGSDWVPEEEYEPDVPVGPMPWLFMLLLALGYGISKRRQHLVNT